MTFGFAAITRKHHPILNFIILVFQFLKEYIQTLKIAVSCPNQLLLRFRKFKIRFVNGEIKLVSVIHQFVPKPAHTFATPRVNGIFKNGQRSIGNYQFFVDSDDISVAFANGTCPIRIVETKQMNVWFQESNTVQFEIITVRKTFLRV